MVRYGIHPLAHASPVMLLSTYADTNPDAVPVAAPSCVDVIGSSAFTGAVGCADGVTWPGPVTFGCPSSLVAALVGAAAGTDTDGCAGALAHPVRAEAITTAVAIARLVRFTVLLPSSRRWCR
ncbi:hypothetical protein CURTO8I2_320046 [Curtobacterium sp. 8I-2]|nr:hypothetical protein CURTO8I2_320046 [Curtobacterium sp. 8I-2]